MLKMLGRVALATVMMGLAASADAASIVGNQIQGQYYFPNDTSLYSNFSYSVNPFIVGAGVESTLTVNGLPIEVDFAADSLVMTFLTSVSWTGASFNGPQFLVLAGTPFDPVASVLASGGQAVTANVVGGVLQVNWQGQSFSTADTVTVNFAAPEPGSILLLGTGLVALVASRRRLRKHD